MDFFQELKSNWKSVLIIFILFTLIEGGILYLSTLEEDSIRYSTYTNIYKPKCSNDVCRFRNSITDFVMEAAENYFDEQPTEYPEKLKIKGNWEIHVTMYYQGEIKGKGQGKNEILSLALEQATKNIFNDKRAEDLTEENIEDATFLVKFLSPPEQFSFIGYKGEGRESIDDLILIREISKELILEKIRQGKEFLYRMVNEEKQGFYKKYDVLNDSFEERLYTPYSASIIYTFLYIYDLEKDEEILKHIPAWGDFLLSMQNKDKEDKAYGAFSYSFYLDKNEKQKRFVVGSSALSIFTLLRLYDLTNDSRYLESAKLAGDWLATMQNPDGSMKAYLEYSKGKWVYGEKLSLLYNGQVLSSLSKLYEATNDEKYYDTAKGIAELFAEEYEKEKGYIEGEYRSKNPISNAWVVMSSIDLYKASPDERYKGIIFELSEKILANQRNNEDDLLYYGGWGGAYSSSGIGWISEVMTETYRFCQEERGEDCDKYKQAVIKAIRWLIQNTYSEENSFFLENPEKAIGGVFWNKLNKYVRTDSVCHALNGYIRIIDDLDDGLLLLVPEKSFGEILEEIRD